MPDDALERDAEALLAQYKDRKYFDELSIIRKEYLPSGAYVSTGFITELIREDMLIE